MEDGPVNSDYITECRHMICVECCQKESNIKDGREVLCPICRRDWTEWIYEHYPIAVQVVDVEEARTVGLRALYGLRFDDSDREAAEDEAEDDDVPDITTMLRSLGRSYRSR